MEEVQQQIMPDVAEEAGTAVMLLEAAKYLHKTMVAEALDIQVELQMENLKLAYVLDTDML